jgi:hypothetical protein
MLSCLGQYRPAVARPHPVAHSFVGGARGIQIGVNSPERSSLPRITESPGKQSVQLMTTRAESSRNSGDDPLLLNRAAKFIKILGRFSNMPSRRSSRPQHARQAPHRPLPYAPRRGLKGPHRAGLAKKPGVLYR